MSWGRLASAFAALAVVACGGSEDPPVPTSMTGSTSTSLTGTVAAPVSVIPSVNIKDQKGKGLANIWVKWTASAGKPESDSTKTDAAGSASVGKWTLGTVTGAQTLTASAAGLGSVSFTADAKAGPVSTLTNSSGTLTGAVASTIASPVSVRATDVYGNTVSGVALTFVVATGAGSVTGADQTTNASGVATVGSWKLGNLAGTQTLRVNVPSNGVSGLVTATATSSTATDLVLIDAGQGSGSAGKRLCTSPVVGVRDVYGNSVVGAPVTFTPAVGSGTVTGGNTTTSVAITGYASPRSWVLGATGTQTLVATSSAVPGKELTFTATLVPAASFTICPRIMGNSSTARQREAVTKAVARWQQVVIGHTQTTPIKVPAGDCVEGIRALDEDIEDLVLYINLTYIDGPGKTLGQAGPCYIHLPIGLTAIGYLELDTSDLDVMLSDGTLDNAVLHEIGHLLGIGTLWNYRRNLLVGSVASGGTDPYFIGAAAREQYASTLPNPYSGTPIPVENCIGISGCGAGTSDGHWRKSVFGTELMQGYAAPKMAMSKITIGSLADLGYQVNLAAADSYSFGALALNADGAPAVSRLMANDIADLPLTGISRDGTRTLIRAAINPFKRR